jgi:hypothetical protein
LGISEWSRPLGRPRCGWDVDDRKDLKEIEWETADRIDLAWNREKWQDFVKATMNHRVSQNGRKFLTGRGTVRFAEQLCWVELLTVCVS